MTIDSLHDFLFYSVNVKWKQAGNSPSRRHSYSSKYPWWTSFLEDVHFSDKIWFGYFFSHTCVISLCLLRKRLNRKNFASYSIFFKILHQKQSFPLGVEFIFEILVPFTSVFFSILAETDLVINWFQQSNVASSNCNKDWALRFAQVWLSKVPT